MPIATLTSAAAAAAVTLTKVPPQNSAAGGLPPSPAYLAESRVNVLRNGGVIPVVLASVAVLARFYTRVVIIRTWGFDDTLLLLAWVRLLFRRCPLSPPSFSPIISITASMTC